VTAITVTAAPGCVFLRATAPAVEMTPGETLTVIERLTECVRVALGVQDGAALPSLITKWKAGQG
jgi:hypothetical protein